MNKEEKIIESSNEKKLNIAATKIQSTYRGYKTRSQIKKNKIYDNTESNENLKINNKKYSDNLSNNKSIDNMHKINQDQAAIKIQSTFRGYKTRKQLVSNKTKKFS
jgi:hypothetical protein